LTPEEIQAVTGRANIGQASLYDIFYDDTDYDYMQHLRPISVDQGQDDGVETIMIPAPAPKQSKIRARDAASFLKEVASDVPLEALPSVTEIARDYEAGAAIPPAIAGFQPDMDLHLRQVLEALEDDAFVDDELGEDFFGELVEGGERDDDQYVGFESDDESEDGLSLQHSGLTQEIRARSDDDWVEQFARFKRGDARVPPTSESGGDDGNSEGRDTITGLPKLPVAGGKRRRKGASDASGYSLTSSSMFRNKGLSTLDEQFAKACPHPPSHMPNIMVDCSCRVS
jgi:protein LTV1